MADPDSGDLLLVASEDSAAFLRLLVKWRGPVYAVFERTREASAATEAAAQVFERLYRTASRYSPDVPFSAWLFRLVARRLEEDSPADPPAIPAAKLRESAAARTALLRGAVASLPSTERSAFLLTRAASLTVPASAAALETSEHDVKKSLVRAMDHLFSACQPLLAAPPAGSAAVPEGTAP